MGLSDLLIGSGLATVKLSSPSMLMTRHWCPLRSRPLHQPGSLSVLQTVFSGSTLHKENIVQRKQYCWHAIKLPELFSIDSHHPLGWWWHFRLLPSYFNEPLLRLMAQSELAKWSSHMLEEHGSVLTALLQAVPKSSDWNPLTATPPSHLIGWLEMTVKHTSLGCLV